MARLQIMIFEIDSNKYAIDINNINSIVKAKNFKIIPLPNHSDIIKGITNVRGKVYPVVSMRKKFGMEEIPIDSDTKLVLININDAEIGIIVDEVTDILKLDDSELISATNFQKQNEYISYIIKLEEELVIGLNISKVFHTEEILKLDMNDSQN